ISHRVHLGAHLIASERSENNMGDCGRVAPHDVVAPTAILATNVQCVKRPHGARPALWPRPSVGGWGAWKGWSGGLAAGTLCNEFCRPTESKTTRRLNRSLFQM